MKSIMMLEKHFTNNKFSAITNVHITGSSCSLIIRSDECEHGKLNTSHIVNLHRLSSEPTRKHSFHHLEAACWLSLCHHLQHLRLEPDWLNSGSGTHKLCEAESLASGAESLASLCIIFYL